MIRIYVPKINNEVVKVARQLANKQQMDVLIESHDEYMEVFFERKSSKKDESKAENWKEKM